MRPNPSPALSESRATEFAVAAAGCFGGIYHSGQVFWNRTSWRGAIFDHAVNNGTLALPDDDEDQRRFYKLSIRQSRFITKAFSTAAAMNDDWRILDKVNRQTVQRMTQGWDRGLSVAEAEIPAMTSRAADVIQGACEPIVAMTEEAAFAEGLDVGAWIDVHGEGRLPPPVAPWVTGP